MTAANRSNSHLHAADWLVQAIPTHAEAARFIRSGHYARGTSNTSTYRHGLYRTDTAPLVSDLMGVALWMPPTRSAAEHIAGDDWQGVLACSRLCVAPEVPTNGASFLLGRSMKAIDRNRWPVLVTYADTAQGHTGAIYRATNWRCDGEVPAGDLWADASGRQTSRKHGGRTYTVAEMKAQGYHRLPSMPKVRFVHDVRVLDRLPVNP